mmetsp:Transcript_8987/g.25828  ORF Transcript_8987/g.25828 Transcript_8987/m.25828 type:complete len:404 (-) Transcript_8987:381-1592(-)
MRRFAVLHLSDESGSPNPSLQLWQAVCRGGDDVWESFQCYKGLVPPLSAVCSSDGILIVGGRNSAEELPEPCRQSVCALLREAAKDENLSILATGGGSTMVSMALSGDDLEALPGASISMKIAEEIYATEELKKCPWADSLHSMVHHIPEDLYGSRSQCSFTLCSEITAPSAAQVLAWASTYSSSSSAACLAPAAWCMGPHVLVLNVLPAAGAQQAVETSPVMSGNLEPVRSEVLPCMVRMFWEWRQTRTAALSDAATSPIRHNRQAGQASSSSAPLPPHQPCQRPGPEEQRPSVSGEAWKLLQAVLSAFTAEASGHQEDLRLAGDMSLVASEQYAGMDANLKGMLAFVTALKEKQELVRPTRETLSVIESQVDRLEELVHRLSESSKELEKACCQGEHSKVR